MKVDIDATLANETLRPSDDTLHLSDDTLRLSDEADPYHRPHSVDGCLLRTCLRPKYSLRKQLLLSFGCVSVVSLGFAMITAIITALLAGEEVKNVSKTNLEHWAEGKLKLKSRYLAETVDQKLQNWESTAAIIRETTRERFSGYPDHSGYEDDSAVPFLDSVTGQNIYPLNGSSSMPIDWQIPDKNADAEVEDELAQGRTDWFNTRTSALSCAIMFQGACDPDETDPSVHSYFEGCTEAHNDISTGGVVAPTDTLRLIHAKSSDYCQAVFRPLWEYHDDVKQVHMFFFNSGAGADIDYPAVELDGTQSYISAGCEWMREKNPLSDKNKTFGTEEEIARCHLEGEVVSVREYNVNERPFFSKQARAPDRAQITGPFENAWLKGDYVLHLSRAVYDRLTNEFIGVVSFTLNVDRIADSIDTLGITGSSDVAVVRWDEKGTVVASDKWDRATDIKFVSDIGIGVDTDTFDELKKTFDENYEENYDRSKAHSAIYVNGRFISSSPVPIPPKDYDPTYEPQFMVISSVRREQVLAGVDDLDVRVDVEVSKLIQKTLIVGLAGLVTVATFILIVSLFLTKPLEWMNKVGDQIVNDFGGSSAKKLEENQPRWVRFSPKTEITDLVAQFRSMVRKFSGEGTAKLSRRKCTKIRNPFTLESNFRGLYGGRSCGGFKYKYDDGAVASPLTLGRVNRRSTRIHWGHNIRGGSDSESVTFASNLQLSLNDAKDMKNLLRSPLFWWIVGSITIPLLLGMIAISVLVATNLSLSFPDMTDAVEEVYMNLEKVSLEGFARLRAAYASQMMFAPTRDLYLLTRVTGWLLFGALQHSDSYTDIATAADSCKFSEEGTCDYFADKNKSVCDCEWDDQWGRECYQYPAIDTRSLQRLYFEAQSDDASPNGDRNSTSFPRVASTPNTTSFWPDMNSVPGTEKGAAAGGHETTYDRLRVLSATSMIQIPLYNYGRGTRFNRPLGTYISLEADGMFGGYDGCSPLHVELSHWQSNEVNNAAGVNAALCPFGKYG